MATTGRDPLNRIVALLKNLDCAFGLSGHQVRAEDNCSSNVATLGFEKDPVGLLAWEGERGGVVWG